MDNDQQFLHSGIEYIIQSHVTSLIGLHMGKKTKCDTATLKVVQIRCGLL